MADTVSFEQITTLSAAQALSLPAGCRKVLLQAETQNVRYRTDGTNPATDVGMLIIAGAHQPTEISLQGGVTSIKVIQAAASAKLNVTYYSHT